MAFKQTKGAEYIIGEMQIKTTLKYQFSTFKMTPQKLKRIKWCYLKEGNLATFSKYTCAFVLDPAMPCLGFLHSSVGKESACNAMDLGSIPGSGRSPGEGNGNPLQYFCLENPIDRRAWQATVHGVSRVVHDLATKPTMPLLGN